MEFYKQQIETVVKQFNSDTQTGLDEKEISSAKQKFGNNVWLFFLLSGLRLNAPRIPNQKSSLLLLPAPLRRYCKSAKGNFTIACCRA